MLKPLLPAPTIVETLGVAASLLALVLALLARVARRTSPLHRVASASLPPSSLDCGAASRQQPLLSHALPTAAAASPTASSRQRPLVSRLPVSNAPASSSHRQPLLAQPDAQAACDASTAATPSAPSATASSATDVPADADAITFIPSFRATAVLLLVVLAAYGAAIATLVVAALLRSGDLGAAVARAAAYVAVGVAAEAEHSASSIITLRGRLNVAGWRLRAAVRCAAATAVGWSQIVNVVADADIVSRVISAAAIATAIGLGLIVLIGPPTLQRVASPPPPIRPAWLVSKVLYLYWWQYVFHFRAVDKTGGEPLGVHHLPQLDPAQTAAFCYAAVTTRRRHKPASERLLRDLFALVRGEAAVQASWCVYTLLVQYAAPVGMMLLIDYVDGYAGGPIAPKAVAYGCLVALGPLLGAIGDAHTFRNGWLMGTRLRAYLTHAVANKALRFDPCCSSASVGELTNLLAVDANNITNFTPGCSWVFLEGAQLLLTLALLFYILGPAAVGGVLVCAVTLPINGVAMRWIKRLQDRLMREKDERMAVVSEALGAIRTIKLHGWECEFEAAIAAKRQAELRTLRSFQRLAAVTSTFWLCAPSMAALASFVLKNVGFGEAISASQGFTSLTLFQLLSVSLTFLPAILNQAIQANVGVNRIRRFLELPEVDGRAIDEESGLPLGAIRVCAADFKWKLRDDDGDRDTDANAGDVESNGGVGVVGVNGGGAVDDRRLGLSVAPLLAKSVSARSTPTLSGIELSVRPGELVLVVGPTGCGKSSLLSALLGDMPRLAGEVAVQGSVSYCPQRAWVCNTTLRENILFGTPFEQSRYDAVIAACALGPDIAMLPAGDATEIGEKGVNLSGGQQQRLNLARACYAHSTVVLLDDVLSAVDAHVGQHLLEKCICGLLEGRTRILVTHSVAAAMRLASTIVVMDSDGRIAAAGPPDADAEPIAQLRASLRAPSSRETSAAELSTPSTTELFARRSPARTNAHSDCEARADAVEDIDVDCDGDSAAEHGVPRLGERGVSGGTRNGNDGAGDDSTPAGSIDRRKAGTAASASTGGGHLATGGITKAEERARGAAKLATYGSYVHAAGGWAFALPFLGVCLAYSALSPLQSVALKSWVRTMAPDSTSSPTIGCILYVSAAAAFIGTTAVRNVALPSASVRASRTLHASMASSVLRATIGWFEATPLGRILNRFSSDVSAIDQQVAVQFKDTLVITLNVLAIATVCILGSADVASQLVVFLAVVAAALASYAVYAAYRTPARELKRLESVTKSPLLAFFAEMLQGASVVRAFGDETRFLTSIDARVDGANRALFYLWHTNQWLRVTMNLVGSVVTGAVVGSVLWQADVLRGGDAGLTLSYATQFTQAVMWFFRIITQLEVSMNDVERVNEFSNQLPHEAYGSGAEPASDWPSDPTISFKGVRMQYPTATTPVFNGLSFTIPARTRCGVVGRTGAGKSSLSVALFRIVELSGGSISIGGLDIAKVPLQTLRRRLSIIQQEPTLFRGTLRHNLMPLGAEQEVEATEAQLWAALRDAGLEQRVRAWPKGLEHDVAEAGSNLSAGERQLVCMARALLKRSPVLVMDEATASVDHETDALIQSMIRHVFAGTATILTVAHRLHTVAFYERVLVLRKGEVVEYDAPYALLQGEDGVFRALAQESGEFDTLLATAREAAGQAAL